MSTIAGIMNWNGKRSAPRDQARAGEVWNALGWVGAAVDPDVGFWFVFVCLLLFTAVSDGFLTFSKQQSLDSLGPMSWSVS